MLFCEDTVALPSQALHQLTCHCRSKADLVRHLVSVHVQRLMRDTPVERTHRHHLTVT